MKEESPDQKEKKNIVEDNDEVQNELQKILMEKIAYVKLISSKTETLIDVAQKEKKDIGLTIYQMQSDINRFDKEIKDIGKQKHMSNEGKKTLNKKVKATNAVIAQAINKKASLLKAMKTISKFEWIEKLSEGHVRQIVTKKKSDLEIDTMNEQQLKNNICEYMKLKEEQEIQTTLLEIERNGILTAVKFENDEYKRTLKRLEEQEEMHTKYTIQIDALSTEVMNFTKIDKEIIKRMEAISKLNLDTTLRQKEKNTQVEDEMLIVDEGKRVLARESSELEVKQELLRISMRESLNRESEIEELKASREDLKRELMRNTKTLQKLKAKTISVQAEAKSAKCNYREATHEYEITTKSYNEYMKKLQDYENEKLCKLGELNQHEVDLMGRESEEKLARLTNQSVEIEELSMKLRNIRSEITPIMDQQTLLQNKLNELKPRHKGLSKELAIIEPQMRKLERKEKDAFRKYKRASETLESSPQVTIVKSKNEALKKHMETKQREIDQMTKTYLSQEYENLATRAKLSEYDQKLNTSRARFFLENQRLQSFEDEIRVIQQENEEIAQRVKRAKLQIETYRYKKRNMLNSQNNQCPQIEISTFAYNQIFELENELNQFENEIRKRDEREKQCERNIVRLRIEKEQWKERCKELSQRRAEHKSKANDKSENLFISALRQMKKCKAESKSIKDDLCKLVQNRMRCRIDFVVKNEIKLAEDMCKPWTRPPANSYEKMIFFRQGNISLKQRIEQFNMITETCQLGIIKSAKNIRTIFPSLKTLAKNVGHYEINSETNNLLRNSLVRKYKIIAALKDNDIPEENECAEKLKLSIENVIRMGQLALLIVTSYQKPKQKTTSPNDVTIISFFETHLSEEDDEPLKKIIFEALDVVRNHGLPFE